jgi:tripartite motif-containing protein 37
MTSQPQSALIAKSEQIVRQLREINNKPAASKFTLPSSVTMEFPSELVPQYEASLFVIKDFSRIRHTHEVVYSEPLIFNGLTWRLKVYPNGNGIAKGNYISIFLEMLKGLSEPSKYEYRVEMLNHREPSRLCIVREFSSDFEVGECWGYNRFYRIDLLEREGFLSSPEDSLLGAGTPNDSLTLKYYVRAPTYAQQSRDQRRHIEALEQQLSLAQNQLSEMSAKYNEEVNRAKQPRKFVVRQRASD